MKTPITTLETFIDVYIDNIRMHNQSPTSEVDWYDYDIEFDTLLDITLNCVGFLRNLRKHLSQERITYLIVELTPCFFRIRHNLDTNDFDCFTDEEMKYITDISQRFLPDEYTIVDNEITRMGQ